jgi:ribonucleoside-diphosphate reductase alpha chain
MSLQISKRDGTLVSYNPGKILARIKKAAKGLQINETEIFAKVITSMPTEGVVSTKQLDNLVAELSAAYTGTHYDYSRFAANVAISSYHKETTPNFAETMIKLNKDGVVNDDLIKIIETYGADNIEAEIDYAYDYNFDFFAWKSLEKMYLLKSSEGILTERPQHMYMRVALWVTRTFDEAKEYYQSLCNQRISPATPIMINAGTMQAQLSSCVLIMNEADSRQGLKSSFNDSADYSADAAGIGLCMSNIRSKESKIATSGGNAGGLLKYLKIINESMRFFNQQGKRPGSAAIYIEPWHKDIMDLLEIKKNTGAEEMRAKDLFTALWVPDNFMKALETDGDWYLFCPNDIKKAGLKPLHESFGEEYEKIYNTAVEMGIGKKVKVKDIAMKIVESQIETGVPYILFKDHANRKSNHKNLGVIKQSNLCAEIIQYTDAVTTAICTLSSIILKNFVKGKTFDFDLLHSEVRKVTRALNKVIDINHYSTVKGRKGGLEQRAIGIGIQGLADTFFLLDLIYTSDEAKELNKKIAETIYHAALTESNALCVTKEYEKYTGFDGSPISEGIFQFDKWRANP